MIEPVVDEHGCELVDVEVARNRGQGLLRITVDSPSADGRVPIDRCVAISREVETLLDAADAMTGAYQLEVSSPGLDRLLGREKDFVSAVGQELKLRTRRPFEGRKRFRGRLLAVDTQREPAVLQMDVDGESFAIPFDEVEKANTIYEFTSADFGKQGGEKPGPRTSHRKRQNRQNGRNGKKRSGKAKPQSRGQVEKS
ncbi:MAG: ribosome maturation factor RimP [bacterium]|nr:ribosome maturation factor RimP [bacterium]